MITVNFQNAQGDLTTQEDIANYNQKCQEVFNTLRKSRRDASGFLNARDQELMKDFMKNMRGYLRHIEVYELVKGFYDKKQREIHDRQIFNNGIIHLDKVKDSHLEKAGVSKREWDQIKLLLSVDIELFKPSEFGAFSPHSQVIDLTKYADKKIPKDVKEILYRPPKVKNLYEKYWLLAKVCENLEKTEFDREILTDHKPRFPRKSADEIKLIDEIMSRLDALI